MHKTKCAVILNHDHCWQHSKVWLMRLRAGVVFKGLERRLARIKPSRCKETEVLGKTIRQILVSCNNKTARHSIEYKCLNLNSADPETPTSKLRLALAGKQ